jgi:hypothetical protein
MPTFSHQTAGNLRQQNPHISLLCQSKNARNLCKQSANTRSSDKVLVAFSGTFPHHSPGAGSRSSKAPLFRSSPLHATTNPHSSRIRDPITTRPAPGSFSQKYRARSTVTFPRWVWPRSQHCRSLFRKGPDSSDCRKRAPVFTLTALRSRPVYASQPGRRTRFRIGSAVPFGLGSPAQLFRPDFVGRSADRE